MNYETITKTVEVYTTTRLNPSEQSRRVMRRVH